MILATKLLLTVGAISLVRSNREPGEPEWFLAKPLPSVLVTEGWGHARAGRPAHGGLDLRAAVGTPVLSAGEGVVRFAAAYSDGSGLAVEIEHGTSMLTRYLHLSSLNVKAGEPVTAGHVIGCSGKAASAHLHFDVWTAPAHIVLFKRRFGDVRLLGSITQKIGGRTWAKIPGEPLVEADGYQEDVIKMAQQFNVPLRGRQEVFV